MKTRQEVWRRWAAEIAEGDKVRALERLAEAIEGLRSTPANEAPVPDATASDKLHAESRPKVHIPTQPPGAPLASLFEQLIANRYTVAEALAALTHLLARPGIVTTPALAPPWHLLQSESGGLAVETACGNLDAREVRLYYQKPPYVPPPRRSVAEWCRRLLANQHTPERVAEMLTNTVQSIDYETTPAWPVVVRVRVSMDGVPVAETVDANGVAGVADAGEVFVRKLDLFEGRSLPPDTRLALERGKTSAPSVAPPSQETAQPLPARDSTAAEKKGRKPQEVVPKDIRDAAVRAMIEAGAGYGPNAKKPLIVARELLRLGLFPAYGNPETLVQAFKRNHNRIRQAIDRARKMAAGGRPAAKVSDATRSLTPKVSELTQIFKPRRTPKS